MSTPKIYKSNPVLSAISGTQPKLAAIEIEGGVWKCSPVSERPEIVLIDWHVFEVKLPGRTERSRHFAGQNITDREGRASSAIIIFDAANSRGTTESGRVYELRGNTGFSGDGEYVWKRWKSINSVSDVVDITAEIKKMMKQK